MSEYRPRIAIIMVGYKNLRYLEEALTGVLQQEYKDYKVTFVDNASKDGSVEFVKANYPDVEVIENKLNLGFARAFNEQIKMKLSQGYDGIIMMNSDVCVDDPFFIDKMVETSFRDDSIALVQPKIYLYNIQKEKIINTLGNCVNYLGFGYVDRIDEVDNTDRSDKQIVSASGACLLIKKGFFIESGGFDEDYFAYMEDIDLSWRAYLMGYKVYLCGSTYLWHKYKYKRNDTWLWKMNAIERNRYFTLVKNYSNKTLLFLLPALILIDFGVLFYSITQGWFKEKIKVYFQVTKNLRMMMIKKRNIQLKRKITDKEMMINFSDSIDTTLLKNPILDVFNHFFILYYNVMIKFL